MYFRVLNLHRKWPRPGNHFDGRVCPECGTTAHGWKGQNAHGRWHAEQNRLLVMLCQRTGITEEQLEMPWSWTAEADADDGTAELDAAEA